MKRSTDEDELCISVTSRNDIAREPIKKLITIFLCFYRFRIFDVVGDYQIRTILKMFDSANVLTNRTCRNLGVVIR